MVRQLREVLNRHSTNDIDPEEVFNACHKSTNKRVKMGPKSQFSAAYLGTGVSTDNWDEDEDEDERPTNINQTQQKKRYGFGMGRKTYQDFLKVIGEEKNLLDLKRVRNDLVTQVRKKKAQIGKYHMLFFFFS